MMTLVRGVIDFSISLEINELSARVLNDVFKRDPVGNGQNDLIAVVDQHLDGVEERQLPAGGEDGLIRGVIGAEVAGVALHDRLPELGNAGNDGVSSEIGLDRFNGSVFDVTRCGEVGLAGTKVGQLDALRAQLGSFRGHGHGGGNLNAANTIAEDAGSGLCGHFYYLGRSVPIRGSSK